jgi:type I restriction enzyme, S subunit
VAGIREGPETFFCLSPAADGKARCFAVRRGEITGRSDVVFHQPWIRSRLELLDTAKFPPSDLGSVIHEIRYGTGTPPPYLEPAPDTVPFVRATDIKDGEVVTETLLYIAKEQPKAMEKCRLAGGELIIVRSGVNTGDCAVIPSALAGAYAAYDLIVTFRPNISADFVSTFLDTEIGRLQLNLVRGRAAQPHINADEVSALRIPLPKPTKQTELVMAMDAARTKRRATLTEADALLAGLDDFLIENLGLERSSKNDSKVFAIQRAWATARFDPHFHAPEFARIQEMLAATTCEPLGNFTAFSKETWNPAEHGEATFRYIEISGVSPRTGEASWSEVPTTDAPSRARMSVKEGDIIVSLTRPHHGSIAYLGTEFAGCVASTGFAVIRTVAYHVRRDYLWCVLRAQFCLQQMLQRSSGGNYPAITEPELAKILIPVPPLEMQGTIAAEARRSRNEARRLRAEAEDGWQAAKRWFEEQLLGGPVLP